MLHEVAITGANVFAHFAVAGPELGVELINARRHVADTARFPALVRVPRVRAQLIVITRTVAGAVLRIHRIDAVTLDGLDCRLVGRCAGGRWGRDLGRGGGGSRTRGRSRARRTRRRHVSWGPWRRAHCRRLRWRRGRSRRQICYTGKRIAGSLYLFARATREAALLHEVAIMAANAFAHFTVAGPVLGVELINALHVTELAGFPALVRARGV